MKPECRWNYPVVWLVLVGSGLILDGQLNNCCLPSHPHAFFYLHIRGRIEGAGMERINRRAFGTHLRLSEHVKNNKSQNI